MAPEKFVREGRCALTLAHGRYVKSHLLPAALTRLGRNGEKRIETGIGSDFKRRADSWYDQQLCIRAGEDVLERIDTAGIDELRRHRLVWSGWADDQSELQLEEGELVEDLYRRIHLDDPAVLQLFYLSLLWRAAASALAEFDEVRLSTDTLEDVRQRIVGMDPGAFDDYPILLFQVISRGAPHNRTPLMEIKTVHRIDGSEAGNFPYVRFYFDGLVAHVHLPSDQALPAEYKDFCIGFSDECAVICHRYEESRAKANILEMAIEVFRERVTLRKPLNQAMSAVRMAWPADRFEAGEASCIRDFGAGDARSIKLV